jgi:hypothetical protein
MKAIGDWQTGHGSRAVGKLTPGEAVALNNEAARAPIRGSIRRRQVAARRRRAVERRLPEGAAGRARRAAQGGRAQGRCARPRR